MSNKIRDKVIREGLIPYKCNMCGCDGHWQGKRLSLELHHKNGDNQDNDLNNLEFLCPNCHATTESYCRNKYLFIDELELVQHVKEGNSINSYFKQHGLNNSSANYTRAYQILQDNNINYNNPTRSSQIGQVETSPDFKKITKLNTCIDCGVLIGELAIRCKACEMKRRQKECIETRPSRDELLKEIAESSFAAVGRKYNVSDNAIRKWCKTYGLPTHIKEIKQLYQNSSS